MRRLLVSLAAVAALVILALATSGRAAHNLDAAPAHDGLELVVFEVQGCIYCSVFRRDVYPGYQTSAHAKSVPLRFVDLNDPAADRIGLDGDISTVPTAVLLKANKEIGRIPGYTGPDAFYQLLKNLIWQAR